MKKTIGKQKGMTLIGLAMVLGILAFFVLITLRLLPPYMEFFKVTSILSSMEKDAEVASKTIPEIRKMILARFIIDTVDGIKADDILIEKQGGLTILKAEYEARVPIMGNVDAIITFNKEIEIVGK